MKTLFTCFASSGNTAARGCRWLTGADYHRACQNLVSEGPRLWRNIPLFSWVRLRLEVPSFAFARNAPSCSVCYFRSSLVEGADCWWSVLTALAWPSTRPDRACAKACLFCLRLFVLPSLRLWRLVRVPAASLSDTLKKAGEVHFQGDLVPRSSPIPFSAASGGHPGSAGARASGYH